MGFKIPKLNKHSISTMGYRKHAAALVFIVIFALIGVIILTSSHAASPYSSIEASTGTLSGSAATETDANASNGSYVKFGMAGSGTSGSTYGCSIGSVPAPCIGSTTTAASGWGTPTFDDEFTQPIYLGTGSTAGYDTKWSTGWFNVDGISNPIDGAENDCYSPNQVSVGSYGLDLQLIAQQTPCTRSGSAFTSGYTSGVVTTDPEGGTTNGYTYTYGYMEAKIYVPESGNGSGIADWPGFWETTLPNASVYGEIDDVEGLNEGQACYHFHYSGAGPGGCATGNYSGWHTYGVDWENGSITYYYDGVQVGQITSSTAPVSTTPMYLILNNAISSSENSPIAPSNMYTRYVRVWQK